jgi:hypothetical protein
MLQEGSRKAPALMSHQSAIDPMRRAFRADVRRLYDTACCCADTEIPAISALIQGLPADLLLDDRFAVLRWVIGGFGGGQRTEIALALLGVDHTRGLTKIARWAECAGLSDKHNTGDSFRHGKTHGKDLIEVYLDEITDQLVTLAEAHNFHYELPSPAEASAMRAE